MNSAKNHLQWNKQGLIPVIVQDRHTGEVRMLAYANQEALTRTLETHIGHFFSRSRNQIWKKGETSGNVLDVKQVWADCDGDTLLYLVDPKGPSCHTGKQNCFFNQVTLENLETTLTSKNSAEEKDMAQPTLVSLWERLIKRTQSTQEKSYTKSLIEKGASKIGEKLVEESHELTEALVKETDDRVLSETADLFYHMLTGLLFRQRTFREVTQILSERFAQSGHEEKASRKIKSDT